MALGRLYPLSGRLVLSEVGCLCKYLDATRQAAPRSSSPCAWPLLALPLPPRARSLGVGGGRHTPGWLASGGRPPSGRPTPPRAPRGRGPCPWLRPSGLEVPLLYLPNTLGGDQVPPGYSRASVIIRMSSLTPSSARSTSRTSRRVRMSWPSG